MAKSTTSKQDQRLVELILEHLSDDFTPGQIFEDEIITGWVQETFHPEDVFTTEELETWARDNGFKKFE